MGKKSRIDRWYILTMHKITCFLGVSAAIPAYAWLPKGNELRQLSMQAILNGIWNGIQWRIGSPT